uniref:LigA n=1 Tax=Parastrongyloides trichosuri TaxID=131310 RepID=A0A0N5A6U6_PARTI
MLSPADGCAIGGRQGLNAWPGVVEDGVGIEAQPDGADDQRHEDQQLALVDVRDGLQRRIGDLAVHDVAEQRQRVDRREDHARGGDQGGPRRGLIGARHGQHFADEARGARQADVGHGEHQEDGRIPRHPRRQAAVEGDLTRMHPVIDHADAQEERARDQAVAQHLEDGALHPSVVAGEDAQGDEAHVRDRRIGDQLLHVGLTEGDQRRVDDGDHRQGEHQRREHLRRQREHRDVEQDEAVAAHLQQDGSQDDRTGGRRFHVGVRQPGVDREHRQLDREGDEEAQPQDRL